MLESKFTLYPVGLSRTTPLLLRASRSSSPIVDYGTWFEQSCALSAELLRRCRPGEEVRLRCADRYLFSLALAACWRARLVAGLPAPSVPRQGTRAALSADENEREITTLHDEQGARGLFLPAFVTTVEIGAATATLPPLELDAASVLARVYTGGTTRSSEAIPKTAGQLLGEAEFLISLLGISSEDRFMCTVPARHIYGLLLSVLVPLKVGASFTRETAHHAEAIDHQLLQHQPTVLVSVPVHLRGVAQCGDAPSSARPSAAEPRLEVGFSLRQIISSGAPLPVETGLLLEQKYGAPVTELLGSSETGGFASRSGTRGGPWVPFEGTAPAVDEAQRLVLLSPFSSPPNTRQVTSDRAELLPDGRFWLLGRSDAVTKIGGTRFNIEDVERAVLGLPGVVEARVLVCAVEGLREHELRLVAVAPSWSNHALRSELQRVLDPKAVPRRIRLLDELPRESTGKVTRVALLALFGAEGREDFAQDAGASTDPGPSIAAAAVPAEDEREFQIGLPGSGWRFSGHFPNDPVLPGVSQLHDLVLPQLRAVWPELKLVKKLGRLKFSRLVRPGECLQLHLKRLSAERVSFRLLCGREKCSTGTFTFEFHV